MKFDVRGILLTDFELHDLALDSIEKLEAAEAQVAQLTRERDDLATDYAMLRNERDAARYEATMTAARQCYDAAMRAASTETYSRFLSVFHAIAGEYAEKKS